MRIDVLSNKKQLQKVQMDVIRWKEKFHEITRESKQLREEKAKMIEELSELEVKVQEQEEEVFLQFY